MSRFLLLAVAGLATSSATAGTAWDFVWTSPLIIAAAFLIAWGAEAAQFMISQGLALAVLAWLQTLPEFAVEADIAWNAARGKDGYSDSMVTANFTGSIRLLMGFGMPIVFFIHSLSARQKGRAIELDPLHSVEVVSLFPPTLYFFFIHWRGRLDLLDAVILLGFYGMYLALLLKMPPEEEEGESIDELPFVARQVLKRGKGGRIAGVIGIFVLGGLVLYLCVHPFVGSLQALGVRMGISSYFFIQWIAPFLSEFPEKVSAFSWARQKGKAKLGLMNFLSSNVNQMTMLVAMIPIVYSFSKHQWNAPILFTDDQKSEILLTGCQAALCMVLLFNMKFEWWDAVGMFALFVAQFFSPGWAGWFGLSSHEVRHGMVWIYFAWIALEIFLAMLGLRKWNFPLRLGKPPPSPAPHEGSAGLGP